MASDDELGPWWTRPPDPYPAVVPAARESASGPAPPGLDPGAEAELSIASAPKRPVIRRVGVEPPATRVPDRSSARPPAGGSDDIFAVFAAPPDHAGPASATLEPYEPYQPHELSGPARPSRLAGLPGRLATLRPPPPRVLLLIGSGVAVVLLIIVTSLFIGRHDGGLASSTATTGTPAKPKATVAATLSGKPPAGLKRLTSGQAADLLRKAGESPGGTVEEAWYWTDKNGRNLAASTVHRNGNRLDLRVVQLAHLEGTPKALRTMKDNGLPGCTGTGAAGFTKNAMVVQDLNGDGIAEVSVGWSSRCGSSSAASTTRLALLSNGHKYIIRGHVVIGKPGGTITISPSSAHWPAPFLVQLTALYHRLYN